MAHKTHQHYKRCGDYRNILVTKIHIIYVGIKFTLHQICDNAAASSWNDENKNVCDKRFQSIFSLWAYLFISQIMGVARISQTWAKAKIDSHWSDHRPGLRTSTIPHHPGSVGTGPPLCWFHLTSVSSISLLDRPCDTQWEPFAFIPIQTYMSLNLAITN